MEIGVAYSKAKNDRNDFENITGLTVTYLFVQLKCFRSSPQ